ncbi:hypothetical protein V8E51_002784 [Hyaloscypha variabilis]
MIDPSMAIASSAEHPSITPRDTRPTTIKYELEKMWIDLEALSMLSYLDWLHLQCAKIWGTSHTNSTSKDEPFINELRAPIISPRSRICGLSTRTFWIGFVIVLVVLGAAVGGGVGGGLAASHSTTTSPQGQSSSTASSPTSASSTSSSPYSTASSTATNSDPPCLLKALQSPLVHLFGINQLALVGIEGPQIIDSIKRRCVLKRLIALLNTWIIPDVYGAVIFVGPSENLARIGFLAIMSTSGRRSHA